MYNLGNKQRVNNNNNIFSILHKRKLSEKKRC